MPLHEIGYVNGVRSLYLASAPTTSLTSVYSQHWSDGDLRREAVLVLDRLDITLNRGEHAELLEELAKDLTYPR